MIYRVVKSFYLQGVLSRWAGQGPSIPCSSFSLVGRRPVISSILFFASSRTSWWGIAIVSLVCHLRMASYMWRASRACSLAPSWRAAWLLIHSSSSILNCESQEGVICVAPTGRLINASRNPVATVVTSLSSVQWTVSTSTRGVESGCMRCKGVCWSILVCAARRTGRFSCVAAFSRALSICI